MPSRSNLSLARQRDRTQALQNHSENDPVHARRRAQVARIQEEIGMFSLTIVFGSGAPAVWTMLYKSEESARKTFDAIERATNGDIDTISVGDDFSQIACFQATNIQ